MWKIRLLVCAFGACCVLPVEAAIYRCVGPGGTDVFTDRPCQALSLPARDMRGSGQQGGAIAAGSPMRWAGPRGLVAGCPAASAEALMAGVETGHARRDVNYLSGLFLWTGASTSNSRAMTARLKRLVGRELIEVRMLPEAESRADYNAAPADWDPYVDPPPPRPPPTGLAIRHAAMGGEYSEGEEMRLAIREHDECLWLTF